MIRLAAMIVVVAASACVRQPSVAMAGLAGCDTTGRLVSTAPGSPFVERPAGFGAETFDSAWTIIARSHWDTTFNGVNWKGVRDSYRPQAVAARTDAELRAVLTRMIGTLEQSHFRIIPGDGGEPLGTRRDRDQSANIGAGIRDIDGRMIVTTVRGGGPSARAGIRPGFTIERVDGCAVPPRESVSDERRAKLMHWSAVSALLRGPAGDTVRVTVRNGRGKLQTVALAREADPGRITKVGNLPPIPAHLETERRVASGRNVGVIRFNSWMAVLSDDIRLAVDSLRSSDAIVIDLRGNLGGMATMASGVAGHFVDSSLTLGTMIQRGGAQRFIINPQRVSHGNKRVMPFAGPVAIVVDELSVSTTEIFAAGLQSLGRAQVFGAQSAGQALPSVAERLPNGDILYHAIANFLSPSGKPVEGDGVFPDATVPLTRSALLRGSDPALEAAVVWAAKASAKRVH